MKSNFFSMTNSSRVLSVFVVSLFWWGTGSNLIAQINGPGWLMPNGKQPATIWKDGVTPPTVKQTQTPTPNVITWSGPVDADFATAEIKDLARGLQYDPLRIFDYVRNQIRYEHYYGCKKGAALTLLEKSGNDFDQSALLVSLLREATAAGNSVIGAVSYKYGMMTIPLSATNQRDLTHWLGLGNMQSIGNLTNLMGWPYQAGSGPDLTVAHSSDIVMARVCVEAVIGGVARLLDPSFKTSTEITGLPISPDSINAASGYVQSDLLNVAGGTSNSAQVSGINVTNVNNYLKDRASALANYFKTTPAGANASMLQVIGGRQIDVNNSTDYSATAYFSWNQVLETWSEIPGEKAATIEIRATANLVWSKPLAELRGQRLSLTFDSSNRAQIWLDDVPQATETGSPSGSAVGIKTTVFHPFRDMYVDQNDGDSPNPYTTYQRTGSYAIVYVFDAGIDHVRQREDKLAAYQAAGKDDNSREVRTEILNLMGLQWMRQSEMAMRLNDRATDAVRVQYHRVGRVAQENGFYIDVRIQSTQIQQRQNNTTLASRCFELDTFIQSAFEHGIVEQLQGGQAVSTVDLISRALTISGNAVSRTVSADGFSTTLQPVNQIGADHWHGTGSASVYHNGAFESVTMSISGGLSGGFGTNPGNVTSTVELNSQAASLDKTPSNLTPTLSIEPVDLATGAYDYDHIDLALGDAEPRGLVFSRHYNTRLRLRNDAKLGYGWTHNYYLHSLKGSDGEVAFGGGTPFQALAALVAIHAALDVYDITDPKKWCCSLLALGWAVDQARDNSVTIQMGERNFRFLKQPNGVFLSPPGLPITLIPSGGGYQMTFRNGNTITFDDSGNGTQISDPYGKNLTLTYNSAGLRTVTDCYNRTVNIGYVAGNGAISSVNDGPAGGRSVVFTQDARKDLTGCTDSEGKNWSYGYKTDYAQDHRLEKTIDPDTRIIAQNIYDSQNRVQEQRSQGDSTKSWKFYYSTGQTVEQDPLGGLQTFSFDDKNRLVAQISAEGRTVRYGYDGQNHPTSITSPLGEITRIDYNADHSPTLITDPLLKTTQLFYDGQQQLDHVIDPRVKTTTYTFNAFHQLQHIASPEGVTTDFAYNPSGTFAGLLSQKKEISASAGTLTTIFSYDATGGLIGIQYPNTDSESFTNNARGDVLTHTDLRGFLTSFTYNNRRQLLRTFLPTVNGTSYYLENVYDNSGNLMTQYDQFRNRTDQTYSSTQKPLLTTFANLETFTRQYDARDWLEKTIDYSLRQQRMEYFADGKVRRVFDPLNRQQADLTYDTNGRNQNFSVPQPNTGASWATTTNSYTARGQLWKAQDPSLQTTELGYDDSGNMQSRKNRRLQTWQFTYNGDNQLQDMISPLARSWQKRYNDRGLLWTLKEPSTQTTTFNYDNMGRVSTATDPLAAITYGYDDESRVDTITESGAVIDRDYDALGRITQYKHGTDYTLQWIYQDPQNAFILRYPGNLDVRYDFDNRGRLWKVTDWSNRVTTYTYDSVGRLTMTTRPNGTIRKVTYDAADQITRIEERDNLGAIIDYFSYPAYWNDGQPRQQVTLPSATAPAVNPATLTYDNDDRVSTWNGQTVLHDADGNLTNGPIPPPAPGQPANFGSYTFDARNRLTACGTGNYFYDAENQRTRIITTGVGLTIWGINPAASPAQPFARQKPDGSITIYVWGIGLLYEVDAATNQTKTYHYDRRGSTVAMTSQDGHTITDRWQYGPYGERLTRTGTTDTPFQFNGFFGVQTDSNGLLYMNARYYNTELRRFVSADPMGFAEGSNFYAFADGDPISLADPFGLGAADTSEGSFMSRMAGGFFVDGAWGTMTGLGEMAKHPLGTADNILEAIAFPQVAAAKAWPALKGFGLRVAAGDPRAIGQGLFELASLAAPPLKISKLSKLRYLSLIDEAGTALRVSEKGISGIESHLARAEFGAFEGNDLMLGRLRNALTNGEQITGADANFYLHELSESRMMGRGAGYEAAHAAAMEKYGLSSNMSLYHPELIQTRPDLFNSSWRTFWGL
jgi:RHS repeat-associated protein